MHIENFEASTDHVTVVVHDGDRMAVVVLEKRFGKVAHAEAVGAADAASCSSFADEAATWLYARARPKRLSGAHAA